MSQAMTTRRMDNEAYAGFLRLWLSAGTRIDNPTPDIEAYLRHVNEREPLPPVLMPRRARRRAA